VLQIPQSSEGKAWYSYVDTNVTAAVLEGAVILSLTLFTVSRHEAQVTQTLYDASSLEH